MESMQRRTAESVQSSAAERQAEEGRRCKLLRLSPFDLIQAMLSLVLLVLSCALRAASAPDAIFHRAAGPTVSWVRRPLDQKRSYVPGFIRITLLILVNPGHNRISGSMREFIVYFRDKHCWAGISAGELLRS